MNCCFFCSSTLNPQGHHQLWPSRTALLPPGLPSSCPHQRSPHQPFGSSSPCHSDATAGPVSSSPQHGSVWSWIRLDEAQAWVLLLQAHPWAHVLACPCSCLCPSPGRRLGLVLPRCPQLPCFWLGWWERCFFALSTLICEYTCSKSCINADWLPDLESIHWLVWERLMWVLNLNPWFKNIYGKRIDSLNSTSKCYNCSFHGFCFCEVWGYVFAQVQHAIRWWCSDAKFLSPLAIRNYNC